MEQAVLASDFSQNLIEIKTEQKRRMEKKVKEDERISETWHDMCWYCFTSAYILTKPLIRQYYKNIEVKMYCNAHSGQEKQKEKQK